MFHWSPPWLSLIRFRPNHPARARFAGENALPRLGRIIQRNDANRDFQIVLDLFFDFARSVPVRECKTTVDFRLSSIFRRKEIVEIFFRIDHVRVRVAEVFPHAHTANPESKQEFPEHAQRIRPSASTLSLFTG